MRLDGWQAIIVMADRWLEPPQATAALDEEDWFVITWHRSNHRSELRFVVLI